MWCLFPGKGKVDRRVIDESPLSILSGVRGVMWLEAWDKLSGVESTRRLQGSTLSLGNLGLQRRSRANHNFWIVFCQGCKIGWWSGKVDSAIVPSLHHRSEYLVLTGLVLCILERRQIIVGLKGLFIQVKD